MSAAQLDIVGADITTLAVDAVVNAANRALAGGGGVDGAIHRAAGPSLAAQCRELRTTQLPDGLPTGDAVATDAGDLPCRWVIHTVGPIWSGTVHDEQLLASCYTRSLTLAENLGAHSVAFPTISAGAYGCPMDVATRIAVRACGTFAADVVARVLLVARSDSWMVVAKASANRGAGSRCSKLVCPLSLRNSRFDTSMAVSSAGPTSAWSRP